MKSSHVTKVSPLFLIFIFVFVSLAWSSPPKILNIPLEIEPTRLIATDINGDGIKDIVVGAFDLPLESYSLGPPGTLYLHSLSENTEGLIDRVAGSLDSDGVGILIADGKGGFEPPDYLLGDQFKGVADFNEDGLPDIITNTAVILRNENGGWTLGPEHERLSGLSDTADFDGDGHIDIIARDDSTGWPRPFRIYYGDGTGNFVKSPEGIGLEYPVAGDLNDDGLPDLVMGYYDSLYVSLNLGNRQFADARKYELRPDQKLIAYTDRSSLGDFTGDGIIDIAVGHHAEHKIVLFKGNGDGTFQDARDIGEMRYLGPTAAADFNQDGISDVVAGGAKNAEKLIGPRNLVTIVYGDSSEQFDNQVSIPLGSVQQDIATGDFNNDGWEDIAVASWGTNSISVLYNDGTGSFGNSPVLSINSTILLTADFDGDGFKDIVFEQGDYERYLFLAYGNKDGSLKKPELLSDFLTVPHYLTSEAVIVGYFDESLNQINGNMAGRTLDIGFILHRSQYAHRSRLYILLNQGNRIWSEPILASDKNDMYRMITGDFNEDSFQDIITNELILLGNGDGTFQTNDLGLESVGALAKAVTDVVSKSAVDLDNDGHLDIVAVQNTSEPGGWIGWGKGDGGFDFTWDYRIRARYTNSWPGAKIWLADLHNDGLYDIIEPEQIWLNFRDRSFSNALPFGGEPLDVNGDGIWDLVNPARPYGLIEVRFGTGNFGWSTPEFWVCGGFPYGTSIIYGSTDDPVANILVGMYPTYGYDGDIWVYSNPWRSISASDNCGPRILDYIGPLNPGFSTAPTEFLLVFSEPIDPATVHSDSVYLASAGLDGLLGSSDDLRLNGMLSYDEANWQITFVPEGPLADGSHRFVVSGDGASSIKDLAGNALDGEVYDGFPSGNDRPGGSFISTFYIVNSLPEPQELDSRGNDISGIPTSPSLIEFDSNRRATIMGEIKTYDSDCYFLGELIAGDVVTVDLDGLGAGLTLEGGKVSIKRHVPDLPEGWVVFESEMFTEGFVDSHLSFPVRYKGEYVLVVSSYRRIVGITDTQNKGTYSINVAIDSTIEPWGMSISPQTIFLDYDGSQTNLWGYVDPFDASQLDFDSSQTSDMISFITDKVREDFEQFSNIIIAEEPIGTEFSRVSIGPVPFLVDPAVDNWNLNHSDEGLVNSNIFSGIRYYGLDAVAQAMANTISHQIGHLLGLKHNNGHMYLGLYSLMYENIPILYLIQDQSFFWRRDNKTNEVFHLEYNTGPTLPPSIPPTIGWLDFTYGSIKVEPGIFLEAHDVSDIDGEIVKVQFYYDKNANSVLDIGIDEYLGEDNKSSSGWRRFFETSDYLPGEHIFLARAMDDDSAWSNVVSVTVTVNEPEE